MKKLLSACIVSSSLFSVAYPVSSIAETNVVTTDTTYTENMYKKGMTTANASTVKQESNSSVGENKKTEDNTQKLEDRKSKKVNSEKYYRISKEEAENIYIKWVDTGITRKALNIVENVYVPETWQYDSNIYYSTGVYGGIENAYFDWYDYTNETISLDEIKKFMKANRRVFRFLRIENSITEDSNNEEDREQKLSGTFINGFKKYNFKIITKKDERDNDGANYTLISFKIAPYSIPWRIEESWLFKKLFGKPKEHHFYELAPPVE